MSLGAIETDVHFDYAAADDAATSALSAANLLDAQAPLRAGWVHQGSQDFQGLFARLFADNAQVAASDGRELATQLRGLAYQIDRLSDEARKEQQRRVVARQWQERQNKRNWLEKDWDAIFGEDPEPRGPAPQPIAQVDSPPVATRQRSGADGGVSGGYGGGTSSASPENLRAFATGSDGANTDLSLALSALRSRVSWFEDRCGWGHLDASGLLSGFTKYVSEDRDDVTWARSIADTFERAGGDGAVISLPDSALFAALAAAGVTATRQDLVIEPAQAYGATPTTGYSMDPVNTSSGNFVESEVDLAFGGASSSLALGRAYSSLDSRSGVFGPGWSSLLEMNLTLDDAGARWRMADGRAVIFGREGAGWGRGVGENYWLTRHRAQDLPELGDLGFGAEVLVVRDNAGAWWAFTPSGLWLGAGSGPGTGVRAVRDGEGRITRLIHERGRWVEVDYAGGRVAAARASDGRRIDYRYDDAGHLSEVISPAGARKYEWNAEGLIASVISPAGVVEAANTYDDAGRVVEQISPFGRRVTFVYLPARVTATSDEDGTRANTWISDDKGRLVRVVDSDGRGQSMGYDGGGNLTWVTERDGARTVHEYDERGRRIRTRLPEGADLTFGWDKADRVTTVVAANGSATAYEYADDADRSPSVIIDPLGGRTELTWTGGLLRSVVDPVGVRLDFDYDACGDLIATTDGAGNVARIVRDGGGRPIQSITPSGQVTTYTYDGAGQVSARRDPDGALWRFEHGPGGRLTAVIDPTGARTGYEYGPHGQLIRQVDPLGRVVARDFDDLGNLRAAHLEAGGEWAFTHDPMSRLREITDPAGGTWRREYGPNGQLSAAIDPTGVRTQVGSDRVEGVRTLIDAFAVHTVRFDEFGRPVRSEAPDGSAELVTYDPAGNPVELLDGEGGLTVIGRDVAGRISEITSPSGAVSRFAYDACGRPWRSTDPTGAITELAYDADSRLVARTLPTGEVEQLSYDECGRLVSRSTPGRGVARYGYDKVGRLTYARDTWNGTRRFRYDAAGQLVAAVNGLGGVTRYDYDARGRLIQITDPAGGVTRRTYNQLDKVTSITDPLGRTTTATYDGAGRQLSQTDPDGHTTSWTYDAAGLQKSVLVDGREISAIARDPRRRRVVITDHTRSDGSVVEHALEFNRRGQLVRRTRDGRGLAWEYDADGNRSALVDPAGVRTTYRRDAAGRVIGVDNPLLGQAAFGYDLAGRLTSSRAGGLAQNWTYSGGYLSEHARMSPEGVDVTRIDRDSDGRVSVLRRGGAATVYGYDDAGQLVAATTTRGDGGIGRARWDYDQAGRITAEQTVAGRRDFSYDVAGQLRSVSSSDGGRTEYDYDGLGRRVRASSSDGVDVTYAWGPLGYLAGTTTQTADGGQQSQELWVDALGELGSIDGAQAWWDSAAPLPTLVGLAGQQVVALPGGLTGIGGDWASAGWRAERGTSPEDPWAAATGIGGPGAVSGLDLSGQVPVGGGSLPAGVSLTGTGSLTVGGLEWSGARVYDPAGRGFLSIDALPSVPGTGWGSNPYSFAGNNPLAMSDPTGLRPATDADLAAYAHNHQGAFADIGQWWSNNWQYVAAGAAIVAGTALMFTGIGGPAGIALMAGAGALTSGGISIATQKYQTGTVDWGTVGIQAAAGSLAGGLGAGAGALAGKAASAASEGMLNAATTESRSLVADGLGELTSGARGVTGEVELRSAGTKLGDIPSGPMATRSGAGDEYAQQVLDGGRSDGQTVFAGHGTYRWGDGDTVVPEGTTLHTYSKFNDVIADSLGRSVELGEDVQPVKTFGPGEKVPDYTLRTPDHLTIYSGSKTVGSSTKLSQLLQPNMGDVHWAACTEVVP